jgi:hypothetical protein
MESNRKGAVPFLARHLTSQGSKGASRRDVKPRCGLPPLLEALDGSLSMCAIREQILSIYNRHRSVPDALFNEDHFLDYLVTAPSGKGSIHNSFRGLHRYNAFINEVQYEYGVCFSLKDRDSNYSVEQFVARVNELRQSRRGSLRSLNNLERAGAGWHSVAILGIVLLGIGVWLRSTTWVFILCIFLMVVATTTFMVFAHKERAYLRRLRQKIEGVEESHVAI